MRWYSILIVAALLPLTARAQTNAADDRDSSLKQIVPNILEDQKSMWTFPRRLAHKRNVWPTAAFALAGIALATSADPPVAHYFRNTTSFNGFNNAMPSTGTSAAILATPAVLYAAGKIGKNPGMTKTALLAAEAVADAEILTAIVKPSVARWRPTTIPANGNFSDTFSEGGKRFSSAHNSFPSGHAITAFAVATVVSRRYGHAHRWVPVAAYSTAAAIGFSRVSLSAHYPADVFVGAGLGYCISRFTVLRD